MSKKHFLFFVLAFIFVIVPKNTFAMSKIELSSNNGSVLWSTTNMGDNFPYVENVKYILLYFDVDVLPNSKYDLSAQWSFSNTGTIRNRPILSYFLLNGSAMQFTHNLNINEETNFQSYYYHWYTDIINFTNTNYSGKTQAQLTYTLPNITNISQISWHDKGLTYLGSTSSDTNASINSAASNIINNQNNNTQNIINNQNSNTDKINNTLTDDNIDDASNSANNFFNSFNSDDRGLSDLIIAPIQLLQNISNSTCSPLTFPLPFVNQNVVLPCMSTIYSKFPTFLSLWQLITTGLISYTIGLNFFKKIKDLSNPQNDKVEVLSL